MTEASKQRMEECITESFSRSGVTVRDSCRLIYEAGMQDPDANKKPYNVIYGDGESLYRSWEGLLEMVDNRFKKIEELQAENKKLREALEEKYQLKGSFKEYWNHRNSITIPFNSPSRDQESRHMLTWFHAITSWIAFKENIKALSSEGEKL